MQNGSLFRIIRVCLWLKGATAHRDVARHPPAIKSVSAERHRKSRRQSFVFAAIILHAKITNPPLKAVKTVATQLASERIDIKEAQKLFREAHAGHARDVLFGTVWTG
jgi:hypothetical protein